MKLAQYLKEQNLSEEAFASIVGYSAHAVRKWRYGVRCPRGAAFDAIAKATNGAVLPNDFSETARKLEKAAAQ